MNLKYLIIGLLLLPLLAACSDEDDIDAIFYGRTWKLSRVMQNQTTSVLTPDEQEELSTSAQECYTLSFTPGHFSGRTLNREFSGTWQVDGGNQSISFNITNVSGLTSTDKASQQMIEILQNADSYSGDSQAIRIQHRDNGSFLLFYPLN